MLVDDHAILRSGLRHILEEHSYSVICESGDGLEALELLNHFAPDIVILDIGLPGMRGIELSAEILSRWPGIHIIILTVHKNEEYVYQAISSGVSAYVLKDCLDDEIIAAIRNVSQGRHYITPLLSGEIIRAFTRGAGHEHFQSTFDVLTPREREVLTLVSEGLSTRQIADHLFISPRTAEHHRQNLMRKLGVRSLPELIRQAIREKLIEL